MKTILWLLFLVCVGVAASLLSGCSLLQGRSTSVCYDGNCVHWTNSPALTNTP
jgi:hypothetical protein